uniref:Uncharacterized protein n=2 Tax=Aegilops tauschii subsp. strangulata TaxID=200361 RepID=A0A453D998_AEGTS
CIGAGVLPYRGSWAAESSWLNYKNCAVLKVVRGKVSASELLTQLKGIFCKNKEWPWQIRELESKKFLLRFPPWKNVDHLIEFPPFELPIARVSVKICEWEGMLDEFGVLTEAWVQIEGIPPKWCASKVFAQITASFGILVDVDWNGIFKSFCETIRVKVACRDPRKIPFERLVEMKKKLYLLFFTVEGFEKIDEESDGGDDDPGLDNLEGNNEDNIRDASGKDGMEEDNDEEAIDELDKANFPTKTVPFASASKNLSQVTASAVEFHLLGMMNVVHEDFVEELRDKAPVKNVGDETEPASVFARSDPLSAHLDFCSEQLSKFEMEESDVEEENVSTEMQCLPDELAMAMNSVKRSLLETLERADIVVKKKPNVKTSPTWGPVLADKSMTRNHRNVKIMDKPHLRGVQCLLISL